jgi:3-deoxy-D-manno-octulosonic-acid transferase
MFIVYDLIFLVFSLIYLPIYLFRKKFHSGFLLRLGALPKDLSLDKPIWLHAVSVGEVMAIRGLLEELRKTTDKKFVISTVTATGNKIAQGLAKSSDFVTYLPLDLSFIVRSVIDRINPSLFIVAETEIWPNLISYLYRKNIPIITVNGRISDASFKGYLSIKILLKSILEKVSLFCVQTERDAKRLICLGAASDKIRITGNMKFDTEDDKDKIRDVPDYRLKLGLDSQDKLLIAGSTHAGEEEIILDVYKDLRIDFPNLKLLIAPRHPQKSKDVAQIVSRLGLRSIFISSLPLKCPSCTTNPVFILDTLGQLPSFYAIADIVFVGGSLIKKGGHNILEPASVAKPILFGPYMFNFHDITDLFLSHKAAIMVHSQEDLKTNIEHLLGNPLQANELGQRARQLIMQNQGATLKNADYIRKIIVSSCGLC